MGLHGEETSALRVHPVGGFGLRQGVWNLSRQALSAFSFQHSVPRVVCTAWLVL